ncbi:MAG: MFS transporter [Chloroflexi bacterium]|nr:MFS transporter [Chloroflexota bacterium]
MQQPDPIRLTEAPEALEGEPSTTAEAARPRSGVQTFAAFRHRDYRLLWIGTLFSSSGLWIQQVSIGWLTYELTDSPFLLGAVNGFRSLPLLMLGPFGGVAADRLDPKRLMFTTQVFLMLLTSIFATTIATGHAQVWNIILFTLLTGVGWAFNTPVRNSVVPKLVPRHDLMNAVALNSAGVNITRIIGPSLAGVMIATISVAGNFYLQSMAYVGIATMVMIMRIPPMQRAARDVSVFRNLAEGARYIWHHPTLRSQMSLALIPVVVAFPYISLMPIFAKDVLGVGPEGFGVLSSAPGVGAVIGTLTIASLRVERKGRLLFIALLGLSASLMLFSQSRSFVLSLVFLVFLGGFQMAYMTMNQTLIQVTASDEFKGRVMGIFMLNQGLLPLGSLFAGVVADIWNAPLAVLVMGMSVLGLSAAAFLFMPSMRKV